jgi:hypothetical protein
MHKLFKSLLFTAALISCSAQAVVILGTGNGSLIGHDLTDPENDGNPTKDLNYNAIFRTNGSAGFSNEGAFNVFDNKLGPSNDKWCCGLLSPMSWVEADFGAKRYYLTRFTASSANDVPGRDADKWKILGSNDGVNYTTIFSYDHDGLSPWAKRLQVNEYDVRVDFPTPAAYSIFRYAVTSTVSGEFQLGELEFFGTAAVPEPGVLSLLGLGLAGLALSRRRKLRA